MCTTNELEPSVIVLKMFVYWAKAAARISNATDAAPSVHQYTLPLQVKACLCVGVSGSIDSAFIKHGPFSG